MRTSLLRGRRYSAISSTLLLSGVFFISFFGAIGYFALDEPARVAFYAGHPELAGEDARRGTMTDASVAEQGTLALAQLDSDEATRWNALNQAYRARFGFPFILCIRRHTRASALQAFAQRLQHDRSTELATTLGEIAAITRLRLDRLVSEMSHPASHGTPIAS